jgi:regulator of replication initiation timing
VEVRKFKKEKVTMTDKQIIIDGVDVSGCCFYHSNGECCTSRVWEGYCKDCRKCMYKLDQQLKAKEQECEAYKMEAEEGKEINAELKAENEELKEALNEGCLHNLTLITEKRVLLQTLTEIKEIAEKIANYYDGDEYELMRKDAEQILQKISECEV